MWPFKRIIDAINRRKTARQEEMHGIRVNPLCSAFENLFAQAEAYLSEMDTVVPYGVGRNGAPKPMTATPELAALMSPNDQMGWYDFMDAALATWLTEEALFIHVWKDGRGKVYGYSILPPDSRTFVGKEEVFEVFEEGVGMHRYTRDEVMVLRYSRSPRDLDLGVSPATAVETLAQTDDLLWQYQRAFFMNGATPTTITRIRAKTREQFEKTKKTIEDNYKGANNSHKTLFIFRQSLDTGETADEVEVIPISTPNSTLAIDKISAILKDRLNSVYGVSNFILGDDSGAKYDNAELSQQRFAEKRVLPALRRFWGQFQHELDRVVGGLGYAIQFDYEIPELTDRLKVKAEIAEKNTATLRSLIEGGATPLDAVRAMELDRRQWLPAASGIYSQKLKAATEAEALPAADKKALPATTQVIMIPTRDARPSGYVPVFQANEEDERHIYDELQKIAEAIAEEEDLPVEEVKEVIEDILKRQADAGATKGAEVIQGLVAGGTGAEIAAVLAGDGFHVGEAFIEKLDQRVNDLVARFTADAQEKGREIFENARENGATAAELKKELRQLPDITSVRAEMIARNETVHAFRSGRLENDKNIAETYGLKIEKIWRTSGDSSVCPICEALDGERVGLSEAFPEHVHGKDGEDYYFDHTSWNESGETPDAHVNCRCYFDEEVVDG